MTTAERVAVACPACSPDAETVHEMLADGGQATVRCSACGHVHKTTVEVPATVERDVVVSQEGESFSARADVPAAETLAAGEEFVLDAPEALLTVRITALELSGDRRVEEAPADEVRTIWTRAVDNVAVNVTVHPGDGSREDTRSLTARVPGDHEFVVGETAEVGEESVDVEGILVRDDARGYAAEKLDRPGDAVAAKDVKRLYGRDRTSDAWSAW